MKFNEGKPKIRYVYPSVIYETAKVRDYGYKKHGSLNGWKTTDSADHYDAAMRHILAALHGEDKDPDSGLLHLSHAACNIMFLIEEIREKEQGIWEEEVNNAKKLIDDRYTVKEEKSENNN